MKRVTPSLACHSLLSPGSMVSPLVEFVVGGNSGAADGSSGPLASALGVADAKASGASPVLVSVAGAWARRK